MTPDQFSRSPIKLLIPVILITAGLPGFLHCVSTISVWIECQRWAQTTGHVVSSDIVEDSTGEHSVWVLHLVYSYEVNNRRYSGTRIAPGYAGSSTISETERLAVQYPVAHSVTVHYDPIAPKSAFLSCTINAWIFPGLVLTGAVMLLGGLLLWHALRDRELQRQARERACETGGAESTSG